MGSENSSPNSYSQRQYITFYAGFPSPFTTFLWHHLISEFDPSTDFHFKAPTNSLHLKQVMFCIQHPPLFAFNNLPSFLLMNYIPLRSADELF